jgi:hypothetical protein
MRVLAVRRLRRQALRLRLPKPGNYYNMHRYALHLVRSVYLTACMLMLLPVAVSSPAAAAKCASVLALRAQQGHSPASPQTCPPCHHHQGACSSGLRCCKHQTACGLGHSSALRCKACKGS